MKRVIFSLLANLTLLTSGETMQQKPYGSWSSPISSDTVVEKSIKFCQVHIDGNNIYWTEGRPEEKGRVAVVKMSENSKPVDVVDNMYNVRSRVHEYGGKSFTVHKGVTYFVNFKDQQIYKHTQKETIKLTNLETYRFADLVASPDGKYLYCIAEEHKGLEVNNMVCCLDIESKQLTILAKGYDFYMSPAISPDGKKIAWVSWNQPNMPWDGSELWLADVEGSKISNAKQIAGDLKISIVDPSFSPKNELYFISDKSGWWNFYRYKNSSIEAICPCEVEFGRPMWIFGDSTYGFIKDGPNLKIAARGITKGIASIYLIDIEHKTKKVLDLPFTSISNIYTLNNKIIFTASSPTTTSSLVEYDIKSHDFKILKQSQKINIDPGYLSEPIAVSFPTEGGHTAYGFYYPPTNKDFKGKDGEKPPLIIKSHGGPTAQVFPVLNMEYNYFTSRGIGIFDVNYGGSTGYGRAYRDRLNSNWGIVDVQDCENAAKYLIEKGLADKDRIGIRGGSAGGYTTLAALAFTNTFKVGVSYYGVSDLIALATDTHKFEGRYLDKLVAAYPQHKKIYIERSPINNLEKLSCPILLLQGSEDKVVPQAQAKMMFDALVKKGLPTSYVLFEGEGHGFRSSPNIKKALESELYFYSKMFHFPINEKIQKIKIENLKNHE